MLAARLVEEGTICAVSSCHFPPLQHLGSALARAVGEGSGCAVRWQRPCVPVLAGCLRDDSSPLARGGFAVAEPGEQLCSAVPLRFSTAVSWGCVSYFCFLLSRERNGKGSALPSLPEIQASALQMPGGSASPLAPQPSSPHTNCSLNVSNNSL